jgi:FAD/FMN-containing dehydrogenase
MTTPTSISIPKLRADVRGPVIGPDDAEYDRARAVFYGGFDLYPAVIVRVADDVDIARVIALARETGLELAVRSGGHSVIGQGVSDGGIVIDLADLRGIDVGDHARRRRGLPRPQARPHDRQPAGRGDRDGGR